MNKENQQMWIKRGEKLGVAYLQAQSFFHLIVLRCVSLVKRSKDLLMIWGENIAH